MTTNNAHRILGLVMVIVLVIACSRSELSPVILKLDLPDVPYDYTQVSLPAHFDFDFDNTPLDNPLTNEGATLGRVLFYDKRLSKSNLVSCASCHLQSKAFADIDASSKGFVNGNTKRNSMSIINLANKFDFFWDSRVNVLEQQVVMPILDHIEMGIESEDELVSKLNKIDYYPSLFNDAFESEEISGDKIAKALAQFLRSIVSYQSKWDMGMQNDFADFTPRELRGKELFFEKLHCGSCHNGNRFSGWGIANIGLDMEYDDNGVGEWDGGFSLGAFSIPSLRNITHTGPYMHDGRFETLEQVIQHYMTGVQEHEMLDFRLRFGSWNFPSVDDTFIANDPNFTEPGDPIKLKLSHNDIQDIIAFMGTLTDEAILSDERFSDPFVIE